MKIHERERKSLDISERKQTDRQTDTSEMCTIEKEQNVNIKRANVLVISMGHSLNRKHLNCVDHFVYWHNKKLKDLCTREQYINSMIIFMRRPKSSHHATLGHRGDCWLRF